jgi:ATP-dependent Clp protease ATP-binding subunit ClpA
VKKLASRLAEPDRQSVLLVGAVGVGKTKTVLELASRKSQFGFEAFEFWETSGSRIVAGMTGFGQWQERCQKITEELKKRAGILHVGNLLELLETGKYSGQVQSIASWMQTHVQRGNLQIIAECTPEQLTIIESRDPQLLESLSILQVSRPDTHLQKNIFGSVLDHLLESLSFGNGRVAASPDALDAVYWLHQRYATYSANPGRPIQFLQRLVEDACNELQQNADPDFEVLIDAEFVSRAFSSQTGLPFFLLSRSEALNLEETEDWFGERVIGQPVPVETVTNLIATAKSGLSPVGKPIASLMFIGPTGVGKTEMAKSLAEFMFGSKERLLRFDMSEFADEISVQRLIGGTGEKQGVLTGKVKQHPFSVVLFDEFEKAHPAFFDLLLQVLGEGRLTDGQGQTTDFSTTIIIITSNLGAAEFKPVEFGFSGSNSDSVANDDRYESHFVSEVQKNLRPELFNRLDRIVPFRPLQLSTIEKIVDREVEKLKSREGIWYRPIELELSSEIPAWLAKSSMDLRYGARPIQRLIHDQLTIPLSEKLANFSREQGVSVKVFLDESNSNSKLRIEAKGVDSSGREMRSSRKLIDEVQNVRHLSQSLATGDVMVGLRNEMYRLIQSNQRDHRRIKKLRKKQNVDDSFVQSTELAIRQRDLEIANFRFYIEMADEVHSRCSEFEEQCLLKYYSKADVSTGKAWSMVQDLEAEVNEAIFKNFLFKSGAANRATILVWTRYNDIREAFVSGYLEFAKAKGLSVDTFLILRHDPNMDPQKKTMILAAFSEAEVLEARADVYRKPIDQILQHNGSEVMGIGIQVKGPAAFPMFAYESGRHVFKNVNSREAMVDVTGENLNEYKITPEVLTLGPFHELSLKQRVYEISREHVFDSVLGSIRGVKFGDMAKLVKHCAEKSLEHHLKKFME